MGLSFETVKPLVEDERSYIERVDIPGSLRRLATSKARSVSRTNRNALVLGTDTVVVVDGEVLGKPSDDTEAREMLCRLSGREHTVFSGVSLVCEELEFVAATDIATTVRFRSIDIEEIEDYLASGEHRDKAGAYGIQGQAMVFVAGIQGCYYNVVGLPVAATINLFEQYCSRVGGTEDTQ